MELAVEIVNNVFLSCIACLYFLNKQTVHFPMLVVPESTEIGGCNDRGRQ